VKTSDIILSINSTQSNVDESSPVPSALSDWTQRWYTYLITDTCHEVRLSLPATHNRLSISVLCAPREILPNIRLDNLLSLFQQNMLRPIYGKLGWEDDNKWWICKN
jgi:hypothetical protein